MQPDITTIEGLFVHRDGDDNKYLLFYPDDRVVSVTSTGAPGQVARWLSWAHEGASRGNVERRGDALSFTTTSQDGSVSVSYTATVVSKEVLLIDTHSLFNGHRAEKQTYELVRKPVGTSTIEGLFVHRDGDDNKYLLFYPDDRVVSVTSTGAPGQVARWLSWAHEGASRGNVERRGDALSFTTTSQDGSVSVSYTATVVSKEVLLIDTHSLFNGHRAEKQTYELVETDLV